MTHNSANLHDFAHSIRAYSRNPLSTDAPDLGPLVENFIRIMHDAPPEQAQDSGPIAETILNLFHIANTSKDPHISRICLHALLRGGRFGRILATRFMHGKSIPLRKLAAMVQTMPAADRLGLAHEMLRGFPGDNDKQSLEWLTGLMTTLADADPVELAPLVAELGLTDETLAFPVHQVLMGGEFGQWFETRLKTGASDQELSELCAMVVALDTPAHAETLAVSVSVGFIKPTLEVIRTITAVAESRCKPVLDMLLTVLKGTDKELAGACLDGIITQGHPSVGKLLATIRTRKPALKKTVIARIPLLGNRAYTQYLTALPEKLRPGAQIETYGALGKIAPDFIENANREGTSRGKPPPPIMGNDESAFAPADGEGASCQKVGMLARLFKPSPKRLEKLLPKFRNVRDADVPCSRVENEEIDGRELTGLNLANSTFTNVDFIRAKVGSCTLTGTIFNGGSATGCTFKGNDFTGMDFTGMNFSKSTFENCTFTGSAFTNCRFRECRFRGCTLAGAALLNVKIRLTSVITSVLTGCSFFDCSVRTTRLEDVDLTGADFTNSEFKGVEFINNVLHAVSIHGVTFSAVDMPGSSVTASTISDSDVPHALFLANRIRQLATIAHTLENRPLPDADRTDPDEAKRVTLAWARELAFLRREHAMLANNRKRLARAFKSMEREQRTFVRILPHLLDTNIFESRFDLQNVPSCRVWGYHPGLTALELSKHYFPNNPPDKLKPDVRILAVYAMGSLGTVAQTTKSDLDCWVCHDGDLTLDQETGLKRKLDALALWAESEFGLEAHFFPMRMEDVRANIFSSGDEESSGSAQALLLKEEFYRTALKLAGKNLAWWVTPPGADKKTYANCIRTSNRYPISGKPRLADFGHLAPVPADEYFGGSLWQMVKAVHSPFKSVLKLGLLESYADTRATPLPLCDRLKSNLLLKRRGVRLTDPYGALFATLHAYYAKRGDSEAADLLTESFRLKANLCDIPFFMDRAARAEDQSLITTLFGSGHTDPDKVCNSDVIRTFDKSLKMGSSVRHFMVSTYQRIQSALSANGKTDALINPQDLTRMGRRIGANFSKKQHKIMRVPFMDTKGDGFPILHFSAQKAPGKKPIWVVRGGSKSESKKSADSLQLLHRSGDPVLMLAWLLANRIYHPKSLLQADRTVAPISVADLQKLMPAMYDFFPFDETFERDINEGLESERVTRVFFIFNLTVPPDTQKIEQAAAIYATNWGEMYCRTFLKPGPILAKHPSRFLEQELDHAISGTPEMILFLPKGSQCKRINLI